MADDVKKPIGRVSIVPRGPYDANLFYNRLDVVMYNGNAYIAKKDAPVGTSITNTEYWMEMASHGTPSDQQVADAVSVWALENIDTTSGYVIDNTLKIANFAADAKAVGDLWDRFELERGNELDNFNTQKQQEIADFNAQKAEEFENLVLVQSTEPDEEINKIWVQPNNESSVVIPEMSDIELMVANIFAPAFDSIQGTYSIGDYVTRNRILYKAIVDIDQAGEWDSTEWLAVNFSDELKGLIRRISALEQSVFPNP